MTDFTDAEKETIRGGVLGAIALVSQAEPGFFATFKESMAASKALASAPAGFAELMKGGLMMPPQASPKDDLKAKLLDELRQAIQVAGKDPATLDALKSYVTAATQQVAQAAKGVSPEETDMINQIHGVLEQGGQTPAQPQAPAQSQATQPQTQAQPEGPAGAPSFEPPTQPGQAPA